MVTNPDRFSLPINVNIFLSKFGTVQLFLVFLLLYHRMDVEHLEGLSNYAIANMRPLYSFFSYFIYNPLNQPWSHYKKLYSVAFILYFATIGKHTFYLVLYLVQHICLFFALWCLMFYFYFYFNLRGGFVLVPDFIHDYL